MISQTGSFDNTRLALDSDHRDPQTLAQAMPEHLSREQSEETFNALGLGIEQNRIRDRDQWVVLRKQALRGGWRSSSSA
jgi:hypothetical protein